ncbi:MAG: undecaprenyl-phosphate glucose phosphotransferase [Bacteriovoracaceae bacterium]
MFKTHEGTFSFLQRLVDAIIVSSAWLIAYQLRFNVMTGGESGLGTFFLKLTPFLIIVSFYFFRKNGLYNSQRFTSRFIEIAAVLRANSYASIAFIILIYFFAPGRVSRLTLLNYYLISSFALVALRISIRNFLRAMRRKGYNLRHYILVGDGPQLYEFIDKIKQFKDSGISLSAWFNASEETTHEDIPRHKESLEDYLKTHKSDAIIIGYQSKNFDKVEELLRHFHNDLYNIQILPDLSYSFIGHSVTNFAGIPVITINQPHLSNLDILLKRIFDFTLTFVGILFISPVLMLLAVLVKLTSPGPILYGQERMGLDGKSFMMWKFRSMRADAEQSGAGWTVENDPRRTKFGTFLRETSLDELPQIFNVLWGDMSLVGPRPERPVYVQKFRQEIPAYMLRHRMKAGMTGWAQVNGWRGNTSLEKRIECDIFYIKNWSLWLDVKILFMTFYRGFINRNAY